MGVLFMNLECLTAAYDAFVPFEKHAMRLKYMTKNLDDSFKDMADDALAGRSAGRNALDILALGAALGASAYAIVKVTMLEERIQSLESAPSSCRLMERSRMPPPPPPMPPAEEHTPPSNVSDDSESEEDDETPPPPVPPSPPPSYSRKSKKSDS